VDESAIAGLAAGLEPDAAAILWHVWHDHHATIDDLARLIDADCHSDVLLKIKAQINPMAVEQLGCPILMFSPVDVDPRSGQPVPFSWWIAGRRKEKRRKDKRPESPRVDVFDEDTHVDVVVELPGIREEDVLVAVRGGTLAISGASASDTFREEVLLPAGVDPDSLTVRLKNGVLLVRLQRSGGRVRV